MTGRRAVVLGLATLAIVASLASATSFDDGATPAGRSTEDARREASAADETDGVRVPESWLPRGTALAAGSPGDWDRVLTGQLSPCAALRLGETHTLFYVGADGRRADGGPANRALGLATSRDGLRYERVGEGPVLSHQPSPEEHPNRAEEGIFSCAAVEHEGTVYLFYAGLTAESATTVNADVLLATSDDGADFEAVGTVLAHDDPEVWNGGDELFPVAALVAGDRWHLYYGGSGREGSWLLGRASGPSPDRLRESGPAVPSAAGPVMGGGGNLSGHPLLLVVGFPERRLWWWRVDRRGRLRSAGLRFHIHDTNNAIAVRDGDRWLLYVLDGHTGDIRAYTSTETVRLGPQRWSPKGSASGVGVHDPRHTAASWMARNGPICCRSNGPLDIEPSRERNDMRTSWSAAKPEPSRECPR